MIAFYNGNVFNGEEFLNNVAVLIKNNLIADVISSSKIPSGTERFDLEGSYLVPSFIDLQLYGGNGKLFSHELSFDSIDATDAYCISGGCTRFFITMATNTLEKLKRGIEVVVAYQKENKKGLLGLHLEGPFINPIKRGAHLEHCIKQPTTEIIKYLLDKSEGVIKMMTLAPECCSDEVIQLLLEHGVLVSAGHSNATYMQATSAFNNGISAVTHIFNAMSPLQGREPGMVGAVYDHANITSSIVCDGVHTDYASVRISKKILKERLFLITDAVAETTEGEYQHLFKQDRYTLPDGTLSGSALTMMKAINNCVDEVGISLEESLRMASTYPAKVANIESQFGKIEKGFCADLTVMSKDRVIKKVMRNGMFVS